MLFNSLQYALFLPIFIALYYVCPRRFRVALLLLGSYVFYASWDPIYLVLIIVLTLANYLFGLLLARFADRQRAQHLLVILAVGSNLLVLGSYKYLAFAVSNVMTALSWGGYTMSAPTMSIVLPLGLSFFTFEFIHYLVDIRRGEPPVRNVLQFAVFAAFFPTQIAGPIKRFEDFIPQLEHLPRFSAAKFGDGARLIVIGLFAKVALADNLAPIATTGFDQFAAGKLGLGQVDTWLAVLAFAIQIYCDFAGYTAIGRGSALMLGFVVPENFNRPYLARNISDFWRRWHISLSSWLRDYLYIPLGGNRHHRDRNLLMTMVLGGLWHGAAWTFVLWGAYHGLLLVLYRHLPRLPEADWTRHPAARAAMVAIGILVTNALVCVGWVFFRASDVAQAFAMIGALAGWGTGAGELLASQRVVVAGIVAGLLLVEGFQELRVQAWRWPAALASYRPELEAAAYTVLFGITLICQPSGNPPFIYFQF
jgi:alginate O-acetyltransferase complex protein AlgI